MTDRVFVEWFDADRPNWGGYVTSEDSEFQAALVDFVARCGPPTKVEFRAEGEGYAAPTLCDKCGLGVVDCHCDEKQCSHCEEWFSADPGPDGLCPLCTPEADL